MSFLSYVIVANESEIDLFSFISLLAPAIARSNTVVMIPSEQFPLAALGLYQVSFRLLL